MLTLSNLQVARCSIDVASAKYTDSEIASTIVVMSGEAERSATRYADAAALLRRRHTRKPTTPAMSVMGPSRNVAS